MSGTGIDRRGVLCGLAGGAWAAASPRARAQSYPSRAIRLIVPFPPGGTTDIVGRMLAEGLSKEVNQSVMVENRGGAGGSIGARDLARADPDGHTIGLMSVSTHGTNSAVYKSLPYDAVKDFSPVAKVLTFPGVIAVHPRFPARTYADFVRVVRAAPGRFSYASSGNGAATHMAMEWFKSVGAD
jgi:tripartite-type tricarboxylate transporter receptor subunit TctC